jgi:two-component system OmpR family response regulator
MQAEQDRGPSEKARTPSPKGSGDGLHILVIDDDSDTAELMASLLRLDGHRAEIALDGPSAYPAAQNQPPDVVLLDLALPGMDGLEIARRIREPSVQKMPFLIVLTGHNSDEDRRRSLKAGIDLHLVKPLDPVCLRQTFARFYRLIKPRQASSTNEADG